MPNLVVIFCDDMGYQDLGCFGAPKIKTPRIDHMADEGMRLLPLVSGIWRAIYSRTWLDYLEVHYQCGETILL